LPPLVVVVFSVPNIGQGRTAPRRTTRLASFPSPSRIPVYVPIERRIIHRITIRCWLLVAQLPRPDCRLNYWPMARYLEAGSRYSEIESLHHRTSGKMGTFTGPNDL